MFQWWHKSWAERTPKERNIGIVVAVVLAVLFVVGYYLLFVSNQYSLKFVTADRALIFVLLGFLTALEKLIFVELLEKENFPKFMGTILGVVVISVFFIFIVGVLWLKTTTHQWKSTTAQVVQVYPRAKTAQLQFPDGRFVGDYGIFGIFVPENLPVDQNDCVRVQYRENFLVIEVKVQENHGKRDKKACFVY